MAALPRTLAADLPHAAPGSQVRLQGWVHRRRMLASVTFLILRDRSGLAQVVARDPQVLAQVRACGEETVVTVTGTATANPAAPGGTELTSPRLTVLGELAQSPQFYKQATVGVFERVYETGPVFRAEPHDTARHLAEYVSLDAELGFITDHRDVLAVLREALAGMTSAIRPGAGEAAALLGITVPEVPARIPVIHFAEALEIAGAPAGEPDLAPAHERALGRWAAQTHGSEFLAVEGHPLAKRPFYTHPQPGGGPWSASFDLLFRGLELVTGGQRLHRYQDYLAAIAARGEDPACYAGYLAAFAHGMPPHGGFAIGLERWTARLTGAANIREVTLFPRDSHRLAP